MPSTDDPSRVAMIGAGFIADYHVNGLRAAGGSDITALVGRNRERTRQRADQLGIGAIATDMDQVLDDDRIDAVVIATPDATHKALAIDCLRAGKAVLLQKPMAMSAGECREIIATAQETGTRLTVSFMHRYFPEVIWLRKRLAENAFGNIHSVRMRNATPGADWAEWFFDPANVAGGVVMQLGVHGIDLLQYLFGNIGTVTAHTATMRPERKLADGRTITSTLDDNTLAAYEFADGFGASHEMSFTEVAGCDRFRMEIYFEKATVWLRSDLGPAIVNTGSGKGWQTVPLADEPLGRAHHAHWLDVVRGAAEPDDTAAAGLSTHIIAEHIYRSAREGRTLTLSAN